MKTIVRSITFLVVATLCPLVQGQVYSSTDFFERPESGNHVASTKSCYKQLGFAYISNDLNAYIYNDAFRSSSGNVFNVEDLDSSDRDSWPFNRVTSYAFASIDGSSAVGFGSGDDFIFLGSTNFGVESDIFVASGNSVNSLNALSYSQYSFIDGFKVNRPGTSNAGMIVSPGGGRINHIPVNGFGQSKILLDSASSRYAWQVVTERFDFYAWEAESNTANGNIIACTPRNQFIPRRILLPSLGSEALGGSMSVDSRGNIYGIRYSDKPGSSTPVLNIEVRAFMVGSNGTYSTLDAFNHMADSNDFRSGSALATMIVSDNGRTLIYNKDGEVFIRRGMQTDFTKLEEYVNEKRVAGFSRDNNSWEFQRVTAVSENGFVIAGMGVNPEGNQDAFVIDMTPRVNLVWEVGAPVYFKPRRFLGFVSGYGDPDFSRPSDPATRGPLSEDDFNTYKIEVAEELRRKLNAQLLHDIEITVGPPRNSAENVYFTDGPRFPTPSLIRHGRATTDRFNIKTEGSAVIHCIAKDEFEVFPTTHVSVEAIRDANTVIHEVGHLLGLAHISEESSDNSFMSYALTRTSFFNQIAVTVDEGKGLGHNPLYHLFRHVLLYPEDELQALADSNEMIFGNNFIAGDWDKTTVELAETGNGDGFNVSFAFNVLDQFEDTVLSEFAVSKINQGSEVSDLETLSGMTLNQIVGEIEGQTFHFPRGEGAMLLGRSEGFELEDSNNIRINLDNESMHRGLVAVRLTPGLHEGDLVMESLDGQRIELGRVQISVSSVNNPVLLGDVNLDSDVNFLDIFPFIGVLSSGGFQDEADVNQNGEVNFLDINPFITVLSSQ